MRYTNSLGQTRELYGNDPDSWDFVADERNFRRKAAMTTMNIADELNDNDMFQDARTRYIKNRDNRWRNMANADELRNDYENTNNKANLAIRIIAPEIKPYREFYTLPDKDFHHLFKMDNWTLVEEKPTIVETIKEFVEKGERCMQQAVEDQNPGNYTFWDGFHNCAENLLREVEEPTDDWREKRKKECPFRKADGCERYANVISECTGACSWVVDYPKLKEIQDKKKQEQPEEICPKCVYHKKDDGYCYYPHGGMKRRINENGVYECTAFWEREQEEQKPAEWSEEDENNIGKLHRLLVICQSEKKFIPTSEYEKLDKWLKSLRPQSKEEQKPVDLEKEIKKHTDLFHADIEYPLRLTAIKFYELGRKGEK